MPVSARRPSSATEWIRVDLSGRPGVEVGEQAGKTGGEQRLAGPGWPDQEQVVAAGGGRLEGTAGQHLTPHVGQIPRRPGGPRVRPWGRHDGADGHGRRPVQRATTSDRSGAVRHGVAETETPGPSASARTTRWPASASARTRAPGTPRNDPSRPNSPTKRVRPRRPGRGRPRRRAPPRRWQIEPGPSLPHPGRRQVDGDATTGPRKAAGHEGGPDPVAGLPHGGVGQADDRESGQAVGHLDLDRYEAAVYTVEDGGGDAGDHGVPPGARRDSGGRGGSSAPVPKALEAPTAPYGWGVSGGARRFTGRRTQEPVARRRR